MIKKQKKELQYHIIILTVMTIILTLGMEYTLKADWGKVGTWIVGHPFYVLLNILFIGGIYYFFTSISNLFVSTIIVGSLTCMWGTVNYLKYTMREEYVIGDEVLLVLQGQMSFSKEDIRFSKHLLYFGGMVLLLMIVSFVCYRHSKKRQENKKFGIKRRLLHGLIGIMLTTIVGFLVYFGETLNDYLLDAAQLEAKYGLLLSFIPNNVLPHMIANDDYVPMLSEDYEGSGGETGNAVLKEKEETKESISKTSGEKPNIIIIMSESLYDTDYFDNIKPDKDPMAVIHKYQKEYGGGSCAVNIFGGGTANTEFEFLTGISTKYYCGNLMYNNYINKNQMSMIGYMKQLGYHTVSIHPYKSTFFNRKNVYSNFGFDESYFQENMSYTMDFLDITISDYCLTKEIINKYEKNEKDSDAPFFNFSVSVGNHKPCLNYISGTPYVYTKKVEIETKDNASLDGVAKRDVTRYYTGVYDANAAFAQLVEYFSKVEEPTVILLFGDHAPPFTEETYEQITVDDLTDEELYQTPVVTWNNYGLGKWEVNNMNANYLSTAFLEYLSFPLPKACIYNKNMMRYYYSTNTKKCVKDTKGNVIDSNNMTEEQKKIEKATMSLYEKELDMEEELLDLWDVLE